MKPITEEWLDRAREDLDVALEIISREHLTNMVAFHSQQAVEKALKGVIEEFEIGFAKIHSLERLLGMVNPIPCIVDLYTSEQQIIREGEALLMRHLGVAKTP